MCFQQKLLTREKNYSRGFEFQLCDKFLVQFFIQYGSSVVNRPVRPELGRNGAVFFEAGRGRTEGTAVDGKFPSPAVIGRHPLMICESSYIIDIQL